ncbi:M48 family metalloprotease [Streptomyces sp. HUAS TT20]|uniref:M48 family metalloprotease n=1 Tax=Streptomyces sp. HUAS TT20 TaxID=3447509 RepID=UPI0021DAED59|nr:M48 family metalloprotease [Streptomyces sp. HUAS 15-9]UXY29281.1 M48 family metalloprotease [Streptomyces sp. HUAS 15-9]
MSETPDPGPYLPPEPQYPNPQPAPQYPTAPPAYPGSAPQYPTAGAPQYPQHPGAPAPQYPPQYPTAPPPQYPMGTGAPQYPMTPPPSQFQPTAPPHPAPSQVPQQAGPPFADQVAQGAAPDDLDYRHLGSRVHVAAHQRGADATAVGRLVVHLPGALVSGVVVAALGTAFGGTVGGWLAVLVWLASGGLVFHRPAELLFARHVLKLRAPTALELSRLEPVWREVTARAGIEAHTYELMVENSDELNASAVAGHVVSVTTYALNEIPSGNLAAVLAHELGHHTGGHSWAGLLGYWYSLPGRIAWAVTKFLASVTVMVASRFSVVATGLLVLFMGMFVVFAVISAWFVTIPLVLAPYLLAFAGRQGELRADQQAAALGFARQMTEVLHRLEAEEQAEEARAAAAGQRLERPGPLARLLSTHPDHTTRLARLEPYLRTRL